MLIILLSVVILSATASFGILGIDCEMIDAFGLYFRSYLFHKISISVHRHMLNDKEARFYMCIGLIILCRPHHVKYQHLLMCIAHPVTILYC